MPALSHVTRLVRCVEAASDGSMRNIMLDLPLGSSVGTRVEGCGPDRPGASRNLKLALGEGGIQPGKLLCCVPTPPAVICIGLNYKKHAQETGMMEPKVMTCCITLLYC